MIKNLPANMGDVDSLRSPREGNDNPLQYSCWEIPRAEGAWRVTAHGAVKESEMT